jgi:hypothetical protein
MDPRPFPERQRRPLDIARETPEHPLELGRRHYPPGPPEPLLVGPRDPFGAEALTQALATGLLGSAEADLSPTLRRSARTVSCALVARL